jgi:NAD(P)-dependent dehydrogenase (short-subunit alcohol dehydrogenase family)
VIVAARSIAAADEVSRAIRSTGGAAQAVVCDVTNEDSVEAMWTDVERQFDSVSVVVANAGIAGPTKPLHELELSEWRECMAIDLDGVFLTFRRAIPGMMEQGTGNLIAISSITGKRPLLHRTPYAAAKMGLIGLVRSLALELGPHGVRANCVCPGAVDGPRMRAVIAEQARAQGIEYAVAERQFTAPAPLRRLVSGREVAEACVFLCSDAGSAITGEDLNVSAGLVMY